MRIAVFFVFIAFVYVAGNNAQVVIGVTGSERLNLELNSPPSSWPLLRNGTTPASYGGNQISHRPLEEPPEEDAPEFPDDLFTDIQLRYGAVVLHLLGAVYSFAMIGKVCSNYFLPSVDCICLGLDLSQDVAAATFMAFATTAPELFTVFIGTFITKSDVGLGTIIGCGMFNILGVATFGGLAASKPIQLDWWPLFRDSFVYVLALSCLIAVIQDSVITTLKTLLLISCYMVYFLIMLANQRIRKFVKSCFKKFRKDKCLEKPSLKVIHEPAPPINAKPSHEFPPVIVIEDKDADQTNRDDMDIGNFEDDTSYKAYFINYDRRSLSRKSIRSERGSFNAGRSPRASSSNPTDELQKKESNVGSSHLEAPTENVAVVQNDTVVLGRQSLRPEADKSNGSIRSSQDANQYTLTKVEEEEEEFTGVNLKSIPNNISDALLWVLLWPGSLLLYITVPDCRVLRWRKFYPITFLMCVVWIGVISYFGNWMISVIGRTADIPESVMGLTFLAAGGSMPEAISVVIMARQGEGGLGFSNSLGGSTMDMCLCLGIPWLAQTLISGPIQIHSGTLQYNSLALFFGIFVLLGVSIFTKFHLSRKMGVICCICYVLFLVIAVLLEMKVIFF